MNMSTSLSGTKLCRISVGIISQGFSHDNKFDVVNKNKKHIRWAKKTIKNAIERKYVPLAIDSCLIRKKKIKKIIFNKETTSLF